MRLLLLLPLLLVPVLACGAPQNKPGSETFCQSYEDNYLPGCQQPCEAGKELGNREAIAECQKECRQDLADDPTFNDSCSGRAEVLSAAE